MISVRSEVQIFPGPPKLGAVAQLGEHLLCKQGVTGSIPVGSTSRRTENRGRRTDASVLSRLLCIRGKKTVRRGRKAEGICPPSSDFCPLIIDIVDRNATGRWQGIAGLGRELLWGFALEADGISGFGQAGNNEVLSISRGVEAACGGSALCVRRKRIGSSA